MRDNWAESRGVIIEMHQIGKVVKVSAIDPVTMREVSVSGPANYGTQLLANTAVRKLRYVLERKES